MPPTAEAELDLDEELAGLDKIETVAEPRPNEARRIWSAVWPKLAAIAIGLLLWQLVVWSGWRSATILPGPVPVLEAFWENITDGTFIDAARITMTRAFIGYLVALLIGVVVGALVSQIRVLRTAVGSLITGIQTMPSIAWFPLAIVLFKLSEGAILFVVVLGAAPAIANGLIAGADDVPPLLMRAGRVLGANRLQLYRDVVLPASLPSFVGGLKQGWAFAWRSLMAGELIVTLGEPSIGFLLQESRNLADYTAMLATMVLILIIGIVVDSAVFGTLDRAVRRRWGLVDE